MDEQKIYASVIFENGVHGFTEAYNNRTSVERYLEYFTSETNRMNDSQNSKVLYLEITEHQDDGRYLRDDKGRIIYCNLYLDESLKKQ